MQASVRAAPGLSTCGSTAVVHRVSCSVACGTFPDQGSNLCHLHWQVDSLSLNHLGSSIMKHVYSFKNLHYKLILTLIMIVFIDESESRSVVSNSLWPHGLYNSPGQNTRVGSLSLLQQIFLTKKSNLDLLHCRQILYWLSHQESNIDSCKAI